MPRVSADYTPQYRLHRQSGKAVVTLNGKDYLLGTHGTPENRTAYHNLITRWEANGRKPLDPLPIARPTSAVVQMLSVSELVDQYKRAEPHDGYRTTGATNDLINLFGTLPARDFSPVKMKLVREAMMKPRLLTRKTINGYMQKLRAIVARGVSEELVPPEVAGGGEVEQTHASSLLSDAIELRKQLVMKASRRRRRLG